MFQKITTSLFLLIYGVFLMSTPFTGAKGTDDGSIVTTQYNGFCAGNIECYEIGDGIYQCDTHDQNLSTSHAQNSYIPLGKGTDGVNHIDSFCAGIVGTTNTKDTFSDTSIGTKPYPFVRIIKIQV